MATIIAIIPMLATAGRSLLAAFCLAVPVHAWAQTLPAGPIRAFDGRVAVSGEVVATLGSADEVAFFNYTGYEHNVLRMFRLALAGSWQPVDRVALVGEVRSEDLDQIIAYAAYLRVQPWGGRRFYLQAGRIPPVFGAFGRAYTGDNPVIGYPLAYQYLTSLRPDAVPATADDLLRMRGRGWRSSFPVGSYYEGPGVPLVTAFRWDTGVQARWSSRPIEVTGAITAGTLSDPQVGDNNDGRQLSGRIAWRPVTGLVAGFSAARGRWLANDVTDILPAALASRDFHQTAVGADAEYSRDHWLLRGELVWSRWTVPLAAFADRDQRLGALGSWVEARYRLTPRIFTSARADRLAFSRIRGTLFEGRPTPWDAPVWRIEAGGGYYLQRNLTARATVQHNRRDGGRVRHRTFVSGQLSYWF
jgi:hypothetical protein